MNNGKRLSHEEIAETLRQRIRTGELGAGTRLPTQARLAEEFHAERGTVRQALQKLKEDGLLTDVGQGSPPRVAIPKSPPGEARPALVELAPRLEKAFSVPHVTIDASCLTAETLMSSMHAPMRLIQMGAVRPESVTARIVLPPKNLRRHYPAPDGGWGQDKEADRAVHNRSVEQHERQITVLEGHFRILRANHQIEASIEFRVGDGTPFHKVYLLNGTEALFAHYIIGKQKEKIDGVDRELRDAWGTASRLFSFHVRDGGRDEWFVEDTKRWFDALWGTLGPDEAGS
ncbi:winged helix-turn-helix domain-containing protein [Streptomyces sp. NPDC057474]|uniref:winged helix-turn-helix domain-containing protein n=1 Tax=Streptomyces sp. NPDC057474 TaxID=3346144 RepID=UPI0036C7CF23